MVLYPNKLPESERVCSGICTYYLHEKSFIKGYRFMRIERKDDVTVYKIDWKDLVTILETPVITSIRI